MMYKFYYTLIFFTSILICDDRLKQARVTEFIASETIEYVENLRVKGDTKEYLYVRQTNAYFERAKARFELNNIEDALSDVNIAIRRDPNLIEAYYYRGQIHYLQKEYISAIRDYNIVIENDLFIPDVIARKIESQFETYRSDSLLVDINSFINIVDSEHPYLGKLYFYKGVLLFQKGYYSHALESINEAIKLSPEIGEAYMIRGNIYRIQGNLDDAFIDLNTAIESNECPREVFLYRGLAHATSNDFQRSIQDLTQFLQLTPGYHQDKPEAILQRAIARYYEGDLNATIDDLHEVLKRDPDHWLSYRLLGLVYLQKESFAKALKNFNIAIEHGDSDADIYLHRGITQINLFNYKNAQLDLSTFIDNVSERHPDYANALNKRGLSLFFMKRIDEACIDWSYSFSIERDKDTKTFIKKHCLN
ncbi:MAG: tetratricopeptide repeat protein [Candidatus Marinimicrobia bacterium]|nr:tetratricopeptide repeat protein [Candidatus Neomarinimicrobiota bacterium]